jgi:hypothetical protein
VTQRLINGALRRLVLHRSLGRTSFLWLYRASMCGPLRAWHGWLFAWENPRASLTRLQEFVMLRTKVLQGTALALLTVGAFSTQASAVTLTPTSFSWSPSAVGLTGGDILNANNYNVADFARISINNATGAFTESGALQVKNGFFNGSAPVATPGLGTTYDLYYVFDAAGTQSGVPAEGSGTSTNGSFTSLTYTLFGSHVGSPPISFSPTGVTDPNSPIALATGSLVPGTGTATLTAPGGGGFSPKADLIVSLTPTAAGSAFFLSPSPTSLMFEIGDFSATTSVTTLSSADGSTTIDINGGGGNFTMALGPNVPEPASLALLGAGLVGLGFMRRRKS